MDIFEQAARAKLRFPSKVGDLTAEQLWDLPLTSKNGVDLDTLARAANGGLKELDEGSFVSLKPDPRRAPYELRLDILKRIIAVKLDEAKAAEAAVAKAEKKRKILAALESREAADLAGKSKEDLIKELAELDG